MLLLMYSNFAPSCGHVERLKTLLGSRSVAICGSEAQAQDFAHDAEIIFGHRYLRQTLPQAPRVRWVQSTAAGIDQIVTPDLLARDVLVTRCPIHADAVAAHALALALALVRRLPDAVCAQSERRWAHPFAMLPLPRRALVLGMGVLGQAIARHLRALAIDVVGAARHTDAQAAALCAHLYADSGWRNELSKIDACFLALPLNRSTVGVFDRDAIRCLPERAIVVNIGRGKTLDTRALIERLATGGLGGAAIDVLDPVPAATDSVWEVPRLLITPKVASYHPDFQARTERYCEEQLARYLRGEAPLAQVAREQLAESYIS